MKAANGMRVKNGEHVVGARGAGHGVLLVGHGTRSRAGIAQFLHLAEMLAERLAPAAVQPALLELARPRIDEGIARLVEAGVARITVAPLLLFAADHAKRDIPREVQNALRRQGLPEIEIDHAPAFGCDPALVELSTRRCQEALSGKRHVAATDTCLLLVGRGSRDESAVAEMHRFARERAQAVKYASTEVAFLAMSRPLLGEMLKRVAAAGYRRVIVQPHLLFEGELADSIRSQVKIVAGERSKQEWIVADVLADRPGQEDEGTTLLGEMVVGRVLSPVAPGEFRRSPGQSGSSML